MTEEETAKIYHNKRPTKLIGPNVKPVSLATPFNRFNARLKFCCDIAIRVIVFLLNTALT